MANGKISVKEIFERLVTVETKLDYCIRQSDRTAKSFTWYALIVIFLSIVNVLVHILVR